MNDKTKDDVPAFPRDHRHEGHNGITRRDYFAAKALQGMLAWAGCSDRGSHHTNNTPDWVAVTAYEYADAMLRAREE